MRERASSAPARARSRLRAGRWGNKAGSPPPGRQLTGGGTRADFNDVDDYATYTTAGGMRDIENNPIPGLENYNVSSVAVSPATLNDTGGVLTAVNEAKRVTVTVTGPQGFDITLDGYRLKYAGP